MLNEISLTIERFVSTKTLQDLNVYKVVHALPNAYDTNKKERDFFSFFFINDRRFSCTLVVCILFALIYRAKIPSVLQIFFWGGGRKWGGVQLSLCDEGAYRNT